MMAAANAVDFWAIDAYGNRLNDEVTIASGGSYYVGFRTNIPQNDPKLFGNVGWNLASLTTIRYTNEIPAPENNYVGGIHIDVNASAGQTIYLDFYICPKIASGDPNDPPVNWDTMTKDYVIKKVIQIHIVGGQNTASDAAANGAASFQKPIPSGYTLSITDGAADPQYVPPAGATAKAVDLTVKSGSGDYPITQNDTRVSMDLPTELAGKASYVAAYVNPYTGAREQHPATVQGGKLLFDTNHLSTYVIEGYGTATGGAGGAEADIPKTGDSGRPGLWLGLGLLAGVGLAVNAAVSRRGRRAGRGS